MGASGDDPDALFSLPALQGRFCQSILSLPVTADANSGLCIRHSRAGHRGGWGPSAANKLRRYYQCL